MKSSIITFRLLVLLAIFSFDKATEAKYGGGSGAAHDPYLIYTAEQMNSIGADPNDWDKHFKLMGDIDLSGYTGTTFNIIGTDWYHPFTGVFDGNGHTISHLTVEGRSYLGLFVRLKYGAKVKDVGVVDVNINGSGYDVGGLVGNNEGNLTRCYTTGTVNGSSSVGGLVGSNSQRSLLNCYSTGAVTGDSSIGGLVGNNTTNGELIHSYSTGAVSGNDFVGGLVGINYGYVTGCFWDTRTSGQATSAGGTGKTTSEMLLKSTFTNAGWDFIGEIENGGEDIWWILEGQDYPRLVRELSAFSPDPKDSATYVIQPLILRWVPGESALYHDVYFGEDEDAVKNATTGSPEHKGSWDLGSESYAPGNLALYTTYYWRVDEVNNIKHDSPWVGNIWSFTTADFIVIDDFEEYNDYPPYEIFSTWIDGWEVPENGSLVGGDYWLGLWSRPHSGKQSMPFEYENNFKYSEATMTLVWARDWTEEGVGVLSLWFYGDASNAAEPMYVAVANSNGPTAVVYHDNLNAVLIDRWREWTIDLQKFAAQGVNLANVNTISIGFGDKNNIKAGGSGLVFFDDIRLYRPAELEPAP